MTWNDLTKLLNDLSSSVMKIKKHICFNISLKLNYMHFISRSFSNSFVSNTEVLFRSLIFRIMHEMTAFISALTVFLNIWHKFWFSFSAIALTFKILILFSATSSAFFYYKLIKHSFNIIHDKFIDFKWFNCF